MGGSLGIIFGLCVLSFTAGAALMYVIARRKEEPQDVVPQAVPESPPDDEEVEPRWHEAEIEYDSKPIHRNPVIGLPPVLDAEPEAEVVEPEPEVVEPEEAPVAAVLPEPAEVPEVESRPVRDEFRQGYLRTFEAARRRSAASDN